jgi:hypothetical protein
MTFFSRLFARPAETPTPPPKREDVRHTEAIDRTAKMVHDKAPKKLASKHGLDIVDLTWEDTGRYKGSCVGPNISDMTIQVSNATRSRVTCMPVIRHPNFSDKTADISIDDIVIRVGNEKGATLSNVTLRDYLRDLRKHLSVPASWKGSEKSLLAPREKEVLVSAQACFLPVPTADKTEFNPVLFNYQSYAGAPAVLAIVATREGTSATIIDNQRDGFGAGAAWGQRLFFNQNGERASFTGTRMTEFVAAGGDATDKVDSMEAAKSKGLSCVMLIQVPLVQPERARRASMPTMCAAPAAYKCMAGAPPCDDEALDEAVIGHGEVEGPFTEIDNLAIQRDARFPIRVTVQFYKATSTGHVSASEMDALAAQIESVYKDAKAVGSLVCDPDTGRSTEWDDEGNGKAEPKDWWEQFWKTQEAATGKSRAELRAQLAKLLGRTPIDDELEDAIRRVFKS